MQNLSFRDFLEQTDALAAGLGVNQDELAALLGVSVDTLAAARTGRRPPTPKTWKKLRQLAAKISSENTQKFPVVAESPVYFPRNTPIQNRKQGSSSAVKINPAYAPPAPNPTEQDCLNHLAAYLAEARHVPGLVAHTLIELKKHFKISEARAQREDL